jgi:competence protein ComEC
MSASVIRAACMLSMVIIGKGFKRKIPPFNLLLGSASVLIVIDPAIILDIGFQLSFCAVFGILAANPILNLIKQISYRLLRLILVSSTISLAAQAATLPVSFFYFGRFPVYFLLSNLLAIPLASVISYLGFAAIIFQSIPFLGDVLIWFTLKGIGLLIAFSRLVASLPNASISFQTLELSTCILLGYLIIMILLYSYFSLSFAIKSGLTILILCSLLELKYPQKQSQYILYQHNRNKPSLTLVASKFTQQSVHLSSEGIAHKQNSSCNQSILAAGNTHYTLLLSSNDFIPTSRPKGEFILLIVGKINPPQFETWINVVQPNLVLVAPWVYGNQKNILEAYCSSKGISVWNYHSINRLDI